jgi:hypothetical protein
MGSTRADLISEFIAKGVSTAEGCSRRKEILNGSSKEGRETPITLGADERPRRRRRGEAAGCMQMRCCCAPIAGSSWRHIR